MKAGWDVRQLGEAFKTVTGNTPPKGQAHLYGTDIPLVKPPELLDGEVNEASDGLTLDGADVARVAPTGSILVSCIGNLGKVGLAMRPLAFNQQINAIYPNPSIAEPKFTFYQALSPQFREQLDALSGGTTVAIVNKSRFNSIEVPLPPLEEQQRIVAILDEAFEGLARARTHAETNLQNARELFELRRARIFSADAEGGAAYLEDVCLGFEYGTAAKSVSKGRVPVLRMGNIQDGEIDWTDLVYSNDTDDCNRYKLKVGDVLFNRTNSAAHVGKTAIYDGKMPAIFAGYLIRVMPDPKKLTPRFLNHFLNSDIAREYGRSVMGTSVNQANISGGRLKRYTIRVPSLDRQQEFSDELDALKEAVKPLQSNYRAQLQSLEALHQSLLQKAFAGELT